MTLILAHEIAVQRVYDDVKARVMAHEFAAGERLRIATIAEHLRVSTTPVREALARLATERLIDATPRMGFFMKHGSEREVRELYELNQFLLDLSLRARQWKGTAAVKLPMPKPLLDANDSPGSGPLSSQALVPILGSLFEYIAGRSGNSEVLSLVRNINDRLHYLRVCECDAVENATGEALELCQLCHRGRYDELRAAITVYHDTRIALLPTLFRTFML